MTTTDSLSRVSHKALKLNAAQSDIAKFQSIVGYKDPIYAFMEKVSTNNPRPATVDITQLPAGYADSLCLDENGAPIKDASGKTINVTNRTKVSFADFIRLADSYVRRYTDMMSVASEKEAYAKLANIKTVDIDNQISQMNALLLKLKDTKIPVQKETPEIPVKPAPPSKPNPIAPSDYDTTTKNVINPIITGFKNLQTQIENATQTQLDAILSGGDYKKFTNSANSLLAGYNNPKTGDFVPGLRAHKEAKNPPFSTFKQTGTSSGDVFVRAYNTLETSITNLEAAISTRQTTLRAEAQRKEQANTSISSATGFKSFDELEGYVTGLKNKVYAGGSLNAANVLELRTTVYNAANKTYEIDKYVEKLVSLKAENSASPKTGFYASDPKKAQSYVDQLSTLIDLVKTSSDPSITKEINNRAKFVKQDLGARKIGLEIRPLLGTEFLLTSLPGTPKVVGATTTQTINEVVVNRKNGSGHSTLSFDPLVFVKERAGNTQTFTVSSAFHAFRFAADRDTKTMDISTTTNGQTINTTSKPTHKLENISRWGMAQGNSLNLKTVSGPMTTNFKLYEEFILQNIYGGTEAGFKNKSSSTLTFAAGAMSETILDVPVGNKTLTNDVRVQLGYANGHLVGKGVAKGVPTTSWSSRIRYLGTLKLSDTFSVYGLGFYQQGRDSNPELSNIQSKPNLGRLGAGAGVQYKFNDKGDRFSDKVIKLQYVTGKNNLQFPINYPDKFSLNARITGSFVFKF